MLVLPQDEIVVALLDTGVDYDHPDIAGRLWVNPVESIGNSYNNNLDDDHNGFVDDFIGWDFVHQTNNPADDFGHGTHVAGTIAAIGGNGLGIVGVAPWVRIMALKVCDSTGGCDGSNIRAAMKYAVANHAKIINLSLGENDVLGVDTVAFERSIREATEAGTLVIVAAGNDSKDAISITPANATLSLPVAAYRSDGEICSFSNIGWKIDVAAPGCAGVGGIDVSGIVSLNSKKCGPTGSDPCPAKRVPADGYAIRAGTSMATPHVVGLAALAWTASPDATPLQIRQAILTTARAPTAGSKDYKLGAGKASAQLANTPVINLVDEAKLAPGVKITSPKYGTTFNGSQSIGFRIEARTRPVSWALRYIKDPGPNISLNYSSGTSIANSAVDVGANTSVDLTQMWSPPAGDFLVILEANAGGEKYYDVMSLHRNF